MARIFQHFLLAISTFFYVGFFPIAPGTIGSLVAVLVMGIFGLNYPQFSLYFNVLLALFSYFVGSFATSVSVKIFFKRKDPPQVVIDEVLGISIALAFIAFKPGWAGILTYGFAFILFRIFDIWKPSIIGRIDKSAMQNAVMLDDVAAGLFAWCFVMPLHIVLSLLF